MNDEERLIRSAEALVAEARSLMPQLEPDAFVRVMKAHTAAYAAVQNIADEKLAAMRANVALLRAGWKPTP